MYWTQVTTDDLPTAATLLPPTDHWHPWLFWVMVSLSVAAIPGNALILIAFIKEKSLRVASHYLIANQCAIDILSALAVIVFAYFTCHHEGISIVQGSMHICVSTLSMTAFLLLSSALNILAISLQRMTITIYPMASKSPKIGQITFGMIIVNYVLLIIIIAQLLFGPISWHPELACTLSNVFGRSLIASLSTLGLLSIFLIIVCNGVILRKYWKSRRLVHQTGGVANEQAQGLSKKEWKLTLTLVIVVATFIISGLPTIISSQITEKIAPSGSSSQALEVSRVCLQLNGIANPFIYVGRNSKFRHTFQRILQCK